MKSYIVHMAKHANIAAMNVDTLTFNIAKFFVWVLQCLGVNANLPFLSNHLLLLIYW
jgi:hypothetical protein